MYGVVNLKYAEKSANNYFIWIFSMHSSAQKLFTESFSVLLDSAKKVKGETKQSVF